MVGRADEHPVVGEELAVDELVLGVGLLRAEYEVHLLLEQALESRARGVRLDMHRDVGVAFVEARDVARRNVGDTRAARRHSHPSRLLRTECAREVPEQRVHAAHERRGERMEPLARRGDRRARTAALEQLGTELVLELAHLERHRGLGEPEALGRRGQAPEAHRLAEDAELAHAVALAPNAPHRASSSASAHSTNRRAASETNESPRIATP